MFLLQKVQRHCLRVIPTGNLTLLKFRRMHKAYLRCYDNATQFQLCIHVIHEPLKINRQFNFCRQLTESVDGLLNRINTNLDKVFSKREKRKKKNQDIKDSKNEGEVNLSVDLICNGEKVQRDKLCKDILFQNGELSFVICGEEYRVIINSPWVDSLSLPNSIMAGFPVYPNKFECSFMTRSDSSFTWYRGNTNGSETNWEEVGSDFYYKPSISDIGSYLKLICTPGKGNVKGPPAEAVSRGLVEAGPGMCPFESRHFFTQERLSWPKFRVMSYNILADLYAETEVAQNQLYPYCAPYALGIDYRKQLICKELLGYNADIMCLQEVDHKVYVNDLVPLLSSLGYEGTFGKKGGQVSEGVACFYHTSKFKLLNSHVLCLADELPINPIFAEIWEKLKDNTNLINRFKDRTTCVQAAVLECVNDPNEVLLVSNTHLYFHPDADHIRLLQAGMLIQYLEHLRSNLLISLTGRRISVVICGDFNSTPDCGVYMLMTTQWVPSDFSDWESNKDEAIENVSLSHTIPLDSAYGPEIFTNFTVGFSGCLDYIFYQQDTMSLLQTVPLPSEEEMKEHVALPSVVFPSDHVALVSDLVLHTETNMS